MKTKKKVVKKFQGITIWVDNRVDQEVYIPAGVLANRFKMWLKTKEQAWIEYYWGEQMIRSFLTDKAPGCQGVFNENDFDSCYNFLIDIAYNPAP